MPRRPAAARRTTGARRPARRPSARSRPGYWRRIWARPGVHGQALGLLFALLVLLALAVQRLTGAPAVGTGVMPGSFTGYAFDACETPSQAQMDAWLGHSPYWAVGIYIAGENRACARQPNLDAAWVATQAQRGWRLLPVSVGRQAPCSKGTWSRIDPSTANGYAAARGQGRDEAAGAVDAARDLGIARGSTLWLDVEAFDTSRVPCRDATLAYVSAWTQALRDRGYVSGFYSSASSGIRMLEQARVRSPGRYDVPPQVWVGDWNQRHDAASAYLPPGEWAGGRVHQYAGTHPETYGGVTLAIDSNFMDVGRGTVAPPDGTPCRTPPAYPTLREGDRSPAVAVLQCLLRQGRVLAQDTSGQYTSATARAVTDFQRAQGLRPTGTTDRPTWVALVSQGARPLLKYGAGGDDVRRLQRALAATGSAGVTVTGVFEEHTREAVSSFQRAHGLAPTGVATDDVWRVLQNAH